MTDRASLAVANRSEYIVTLLLPCSINKTTAAYKNPTRSTHWIQTSYANILNVAYDPETCLRQYFSRLFTCRLHHTEESATHRHAQDKEIYIGALYYRSITLLRHKAIEHPCEQRYIDKHVYFTTLWTRHQERNAIHLKRLSATWKLYLLPSHHSSSRLTPRL